MTQRHKNNNRVYFAKQEQYCSSQGMSPIVRNCFRFCDNYTFFSTPSQKSCQKKVLLEWNQLFEDDIKKQISQIQQANTAFQQQGHQSSTSHNRSFKYDSNDHHQHHSKNFQSFERAAAHGNEGLTRHSYSKEKNNYI